MEIQKIVLNIRKDEKLISMRNLEILIYTNERRHRYTKQVALENVFIEFMAVIDKIDHFLQKGGQNERTQDEKDRESAQASSLDSGSQGSTQKGKGMGNEET